MATDYIFASSRPDNLKGYFSRMVERDLAWGDRGMLRAMGSVSAGFGLHIGTFQTSPGINQSAMFFGSYRISGGDQMPRWLANGQLHGSFSQAAGFSPNDNWWQKTAKGSRSLMLGRTLLPVVGTLFSGYIGYSSARQEGRGFFGSVAAGGVEIAKVSAYSKMAAFALTNPYGAAAATVAAATFGGIYATGVTINQGNQYLQNKLSPGMNQMPSMAMHTQQAATSRQRAIRSISQSNVNVLRALGNESTYFHTPKSAYGNIMNPGHIQAPWMPGNAGIY